MIATLKAMTPAGLGQYVSPKVRTRDGREVPAYRRTPFVNLLNRALMDLAGGRIENLGVAAPPRHGKTRILTELMAAWFIACNPAAQVIVASHSARLATRFSQNARDILVEHGGGKLFAAEVRPDRMAADNWSTTEGGGMLAIGVGGSLVGFGADLLIMDDVIADSASALSETVRNNTIDWYQSTAESRLNSGARQIFTMQRWHGDDPFQRVVLDNPEQWDAPGSGTTLVIPAIADHEPSKGEADPLGREPGEALWPEKFPIRRLRMIEKSKSFWFAAQYQQRPVPRGGGMIQRQWIEDKAIRYFPSDVDARVRWWDRAATEGGGDYTVGLLMSRKGNHYYIEDVVRGQWGSTRRDEIILQTCKDDNKRHPNGLSTWAEQEPGSAGKDNTLAFEKMLRGFSAHCEVSSGSKEVRADAMASAFGAGEVHVVQGTRDDPNHGDGHHRGRDFDWYEPLVVELSMFPVGKYDDSVDAASGAFNKLALHEGDRESEVFTPGVDVLPENYQMEGVAWPS